MLREVKLSWFNKNITSIEIVEISSRVASFVPLANILPSHELCKSFAFFVFETLANRFRSVAHTAPYASFPGTTIDDYYSPGIFVRRRRNDSGNEAWPE